MNHANTIILVSYRLKYLNHFFIFEKKRINAMFDRIKENVRINRIMKLINN